MSDRNFFVSLREATNTEKISLRRTLLKNISFWQEDLLSRATLVKSSLFPKKFTSSVDVDDIKLSSGVKILL